MRRWHRPWRISRWIDYDGRTVVWELHTAPCPDCPDCRGEGGWLTGGPYGDDAPDYELCSWCGGRALPPLRVPAWADRLVPRSPTRAQIADEPPF